MSDWKQLAPRDSVPVLGKRIAQRELFSRVCVRPPYFILDDFVWDGARLKATASAETLAFCERGPMTAAELGRHAAIAGLCRAALAQPDAVRRYYLARRAACHYSASSLSFGSSITFEAELIALDKRYAQARVRASVADEPLASFELSYAVLNEATFERLFQHRQQPPAEPGPSPYRSLLHPALEQGEGWAEQRFVVPLQACAGHFDAHPALPVAILMGQLSYLAGRLVTPEGASYRVLEGQIEASDLCWAGEEIRLRAERVALRGLEQTFLCTALTGGREVGRMTLRLERDALSLGHN